MTKTGKTLTKQGCIIGNATAACRVVLWEANVNRLQADTSYTMTDVAIKKYNVNYVPVIFR